MTNTRTLMTNTEKLTNLNIHFPKWIDYEQLITYVLTLEGLDLYNMFGFNDSTSCTKFLSKYIPDKPKNMKFSKHLQELLSK